MKTRLFAQSLDLGKSETERVLFRKTNTEKTREHISKYQDV